MSDTFDDEDVEDLFFEEVPFFKPNMPSSSRKNLNFKFE